MCVSVPSRNHPATNHPTGTVTSALRAVTDTILVSITGYRDPDLVTTVEDCLAKAARTDRLRFGICWQHASDERLSGWLDDSRFGKLDPTRGSQGAC